MRALKLMVVAVVSCVAIGCASSAQVNYELPDLDTVGDFVPLHQDIQMDDRLSYVLPEGWNVVGYGDDGVLTLESREAHSATVRVRLVSRSDIPSMEQRPEHCQHFYAYCTPVSSALTTPYGVVRWQQTVYIDNGYDGVYRLDSVWNGSAISRGIPTLIGVVARSLVRTNR